ncbi:MAG: hypothetical protein ACTHJW_16670 [Streptosporangiaceae bacterium]
MTKVTYHGFSAISGRRWDHRRYHVATMGVELTCSDGQRFVTCWGDAFGHFGLELLAGTADDVFQNDPDSRDFSMHKWWAPFAQSRVSAGIVWRVGHVDRTDHEPDEPAPVAVTLASDQHLVWVAAARASGAGTSPMARGGFVLGADEVLVTADRDFARSIGLAV